MLFQITRPSPNSTTYWLKSSTLKTYRYTDANTAIENKFERPSQKLPSRVRTNRAWVRAVAVNHQTRRNFQASRKVRFTLAGRAPDECGGAEDDIMGGDKT